jgi:hypothetical protein
LIELLAAETCGCANSSEVGWIRTEPGSGHALIPMLLMRLALTPTNCAVTEPKPTRSS